MKRFFISLFVLAVTSAAFAQSGNPVRQSGNVTPGQVPWWVTSGVIGGGVSSADSPVTSFGVTNNGANGICANSDRITAAGRNTLCIGSTTSGGGFISVQNYGTAPAQGITFNVNGTSTGFPIVTLPVVAGDVPIFSNTSGTLADSSILSIGTISSSSYAGFGNNIADAISRHVTTKMPLVTTDRLVNWNSINDQTFSDFSVLSPVNGTSNLYAAYASNLNTSTAFNFAHIGGFEDLMHHSGTGTIATQFSFLSLPTYDGPVTDRKAFRAGDVAGLGVIQNNIGLSIGELTRGVNNYAIQTEGATPSTFGGTVFGTALGTGSIAPFVASGTLPAYGWTLASNGANQKNWDALQTATDLRFRALSDDNLTVANWAVVNRGAGATVSNVTYPVNVIGTKAGSGSTAPFVAAGTLPAYGWTLSTNGADQKNWDILETSTGLLFRALSDDNLSFNTFLAFSRGVGTAVTNAFLNTSLVITGYFSPPAPTTKTTDYVLATTDHSLIFNCSGTCTLTLPSAVTYSGRLVVLKTIAAQTVVSAASNVVPQAGGAAGTAILAATAGKWSQLQSDGTNWQIMMSN